MPQVYPDFSTSFANLGTAMFGDPSLIVAGQRSAAERAYREGMLDNAAEELRLKAPLYQAQTAQANANAGYDIARTKTQDQQTQAQSALAEIVTQGFQIDQNTNQMMFDPAKAGLAMAAALKSDSTGQLAKSLGDSFGRLQATLIAQNPAATEDALRRAALMQGNKPAAGDAFTTGQVQQLENNELNRRLAVQQLINQGKANEPVIVGDAVFSMPGDPRFSRQDAFAPQSLTLNPPATATQSPVADAVVPQVAPQSQPAGSVPMPYTDSATGAIIVPDKKSFRAIAPANRYVPFSIDPSQERSAYNAWVKENPGSQNVGALQSLNILERFADNIGNDPYQGPFGQPASFLPTWLGGNPAAAQFRQQSSILASRARTEPGSVSNYEQQLFLQRVPNLSNSREANAAIIQVGKIGEQKATETEIWLQRFIASGGSLAQGQALINEYLADPQNLGVIENDDGTVTANPSYPKIDQWHQKKMAEWRPETQASQTSSLPSAVAPEASAPPAGIDLQTWEYMTPEERALFQP